jgi:hypothetical protein
MMRGCDVRVQGDAILTSNALLYSFAAAQLPKYRPVALFYTDFQRLTGIQSCIPRLAYT